MAELVSAKEDLLQANNQLQQQQEQLQRAHADLSTMKEALTKEQQESAGWKTEVPVVNEGGCGCQVCILRCLFQHCLAGPGGSGV